MFLDEVKMRQLRTGIDGKILKRAYPVSSRLVALSPTGVMTFFSSSVTTWPGKRDAWIQFVELLDWEAALAAPGNLREKANTAIFGDVRVSCNDPSFLYHGYKYIVTQLGALYEPGADWEGDAGPENRFPQVRNPELEGVVCKHLSNVLYVCTMSGSVVARLIKEMVRTGDIILPDEVEPEDKPEEPTETAEEEPSEEEETEEEVPEGEEDEG